RLKKNLRNLSRLKSPVTDPKVLLMMDRWELWQLVAMQVPRNLRKRQNNTKMATKHILQWNCRGLNANLPELDILLQKFSPAVICLQETLQTENKPINLRKYSHF